MTEAKERVDYGAQITALLPGHTHRTSPGIFNLFDGTTWTWTTPAGTWSTTWPGMGGPLLSTPFGDLRLNGGSAEATYQQMVGVLIALGGIELPDAGGQ